MHSRKSAKSIEEKVRHADTSSDTRFIAHATIDSNENIDMTKEIHNAGDGEGSSNSGDPLLSTKLSLNIIMNHEDHTNLSGTPESTSPVRWVP